MILHSLSDLNMMFDENADLKKISIKNHSKNKVEVDPEYLNHIRQHLRDKKERAQIKKNDFIRKQQKQQESVISSRIKETEQQCKEKNIGDNRERVWLKTKETIESYNHDFIEGMFGAYSGKATYGSFLPIAKFNHKF